MATPLIAFMKFLAFTALVARLSSTRAEKPKTPTWAKTEPYGHEYKSVLQFYFHETKYGKARSYVQIAQPTENFTSSPFGILVMADNPLTTGPSPTSTHVGQAQGIYGVASMKELSLIMGLTYNFVEGPYDRSSISLLCRNSIMEPIREFPIVGGTGLFRMARGYALAHTYSWNHTSEVVIVGYNVTIFHPFNKFHDYSF